MMERLVEFWASEEGIPQSPTTKHDLGCPHVMLYGEVGKRRQQACKRTLLFPPSPPYHGQVERLVGVPPERCRPGPLKVCRLSQGLWRRERRETLNGADNAGSF